MSIRYLATSTALAVAAILLQCHAGFATDLDIVLTAAKRTREGLVSGAGRGTLLEEDDKGAILNHADFHVWFKKEKLHVTLDYSKRPVDGHFKDEKQAIIFDGSALFAARFTPNIRPLECETMVFSSTKEMAEATAQRNSGFAWRLNALSAQLFDIDAVVDKLGRSAISIERIDDGTLRGTYHIASGDYDVIFECPQITGFNVSRVQFIGRGAAHTSRQLTADWRHAQGLWYVTKIIETSTGLGRRTELRLDEFTPNVDVSDDKFTLEALELKRGSRIIDQRPGIKQRIYFYQPDM